MPPQNLMRKHAGLFQQQQSDPGQKFGLFSPNTRKESSPIMEENSCSDNLSNFGQGPSPMKPLGFQTVAAPLAPFTTGQKSMTPMPKLLHAFSQPLPREASSNSSD